jgi:hypothetical protein
MDEDSYFAVEATPTNGADPDPLVVHQPLHTQET